MANEFKIKNGLVVSGSADIEQDLTVHGTITADQLNISIVSSSVMYESGSTKFGDSFDDNHDFTGSLNITGSINLNGQTLGTGKLDETTFNSFTASYVSDSGSFETRIGDLESFSSSIDNTFVSEIEFGNYSSSINSFTSSIDGRVGNLETESGSIRSNFNTFTSSYTNVSSSLDSRLDTLETLSGSFTGSFSGSFVGNGANLFNIPASGVTGLNLTQIADGNVTASVSNTNGLRVNSKAEITGSLIVTDGITGSIDYINITNKPTLVSGSSQIGITGTTGYSTFSGSLSSSLGLLSSSIATTDGNQNTRLGLIEISTGSLNTFTSSASGRLISLETESGSVRTTLNSYTSSNDTTNSTQNGRLTSIEGVTGSVSSLNTYTGSLNTFTSSASGRLTSLETASSSIRTDFNSFTSSNNTIESTQNGRLTSIESTTGSLNSFTSSLSGAVEVTGSNLTVKGNLLVKGTTTQIDSTTVSIGDNIIQLNGTGATNAGLVVRDATAPSSVSGSLLWDTTNDRWIAGALGSEDRIILATELTTLSSSLNSRATSLESASGSIRTDFNSYTGSNNTTNTTQNSRLTSIEGVTSSLNTYTGSNNTVIGTLQTSTSSLNSFTSSIATTIKNKLNTDGVVSGSSQVLNGTTIHSGAFFNGISVVSGSSQIDVTATTNYTTFSSSIATTDLNQNTRLTSIESKTGSISSLNTYTGSNNTVIGTLQTTTSSLNLYTSSNTTNINAIHTSTGSLNTFTSSASGRLTSLEGVTGSYATTGSNIFIGDQTVTGSLYVTQDLIVQGSSSLQNITASAVSIGTNKIILNNNSPSVRYAGISVFDSGSTDVTASLLYDSLTNNWKFEHNDIGTNDASVLLFGPLGSDIDNTPLLEANYLTKVEDSGHGHHLTTSSVFDNGSKVAVNNNTEITGSLTVTGVINSTTTPLVSGALQIVITGTTGYSTFSSSIATTDLNQNTRLTSIEGKTGSIALLNTYTGSNNTIIGTLQNSTSSLNSYTSSNTTNINSIHTSTGSLNQFTSSVSGRLNSIEGVTGSIFSLNTFTGSVSAFTSSASGRLTSIEGKTGSIALLNTYTGSNNATNTTQDGRLTSIEGKTGSISLLNLFTGSVSTFTSSVSMVTNSLQLTTASLNSYTGSNNTVIGTLQTATGSLNSYTGSLSAAIEVTGSNLTVKGNLLVKGTSTQVDSTTVSIGDNIIQLNGTGATNAGLVVRDATSPNTVSGSFLWDTTNDKWIAGTLGSEDDVVLRTGTQTLTNKTINASQLVDASVTNAKLATPSITIAGTSTALGGSITTATILSGTGVVSGSAQILNGTGFVKVVGTTVSYDNSTYLSGTVAVANGGTGATDAATARTNLGATTVGGNLFTLTNPSAITFPRINANNTISALSAVDFRTAIGAGTSSTLGTVTSVGGTGTVSGLSLSGTVTSTGNLTLGGTLTLTSGNVTTALGFTPYNATNPSGYISSYTETDTLATVTSRGNTTTGDINVNGNILLTGTATTTNQARTIDFTGFDKEGITDSSDRAYIQHTTNTGGHAGSVLVISSQNDADDGIAFLTNASSKLKHNSNNIATETFVTSQGYITSAGTATNVSGTVAVANGGTGATDAATARTNLGLAIGTNVLAQRTFGTAANNNTGDFAAFNATTYVGTTAIALNRASAAQTLTGVSISGNATTATTAGALTSMNISQFTNNSGYATLSGSNSFSNSYNEFGDGVGSVSNDGSWNGRLNVAGSQHARIDVVSVSDGIITTMFSHIGQNTGRVGTYSNHSLSLMVNGSTRVSIDTSGHLLPNSNNTHNLGSPSLGWANVYTNDLHLSNMNKPEGNEIDGTNGTWTIQEGAENLYIINNNNGKKFKISLEEII